MSRNFQLCSVMSSSKICESQTLLGIAGRSPRRSEGVWNQQNYGDVIHLNIWERALKSIWITPLLPPCTKVIHFGIGLHSQNLVLKWCTIAKMSGSNGQPNWYTVTKMNTNFTRLRVQFKLVIVDCVPYPSPLLNHPTQIARTLRAGSIGNKQISTCLPLMVPVPVTTPSPGKWVLSISQSIQSCSTNMSHSTNDPSSSNTWKLRLRSISWCKVGCVWLN